MNRNLATGLTYSAISAVAAIIATLVMIRQCSIAENDSIRRYSEIKFIFTKYGDDLIVEQVAGDSYYLDSIEIIPIFSMPSVTPFQEGIPCQFKLRKPEKNRENVYFVKNVAEEVCVIQGREECDDSTILIYSIKYDVNGREYVQQIGR